MSIVEKDRAFAAQVHAGQERKYTGEPYIVHPLEVEQILREFPFPDEVYAAAVLHDTVEDTSATHEDIITQFGDRVSSLVWQVTDVSIGSHLNRKARKAMDIDHLTNADYDAASIKLADLISNSTSIVGNDPSFAAVYMREKEQLLEAMTGGHPVLRDRALRILINFQELKLPSY